LPETFIKLVDKKYSDIQSIIIGTIFDE
jgi:hypothetical protein